MQLSLMFINDYAILRIIESTKKSSAAGWFGMNRNKFRSFEDFCRSFLLYYCSSEIMQRKILKRRLNWESRNTYEDTCWELIQNFITSIGTWPNKKYTVTEMLPYHMRRNIAPNNLSTTSRLIEYLRHVEIIRYHHKHDGRPSYSPYDNQKKNPYANAINSGSQEDRCSNSRWFQLPRK